MEAAWRRAARMMEIRLRTQAPRPGPIGTIVPVSRLDSGLRRNDEKNQFAGMTIFCQPSGETYLVAVQ
jgi:hypothetical protein